MLIVSEMFSDFMIVYIVYCIDLGSFCKKWLVWCRSRINITVVISFLLLPTSFIDNRLLILCRIIIGNKKQNCRKHIVPNNYW